MADLQRSAKKMSVSLIFLIALVIVVVLFVRASKKNTATWYPVPFTKGEAYVAKSTILGAFERIEKGAVLIYESTGFSRYDGYIGFFFTDSEGKKRRWDIFDTLDPIAESAKVFEKTQK